MEPLVPVDASSPMVAQLAFGADTLDCLNCLVDLRVVRLVRMSLDPEAHIVGQAGGCVTSTGSGQLRGRDRFARTGELEVLRLSHRTVSRRRDNPAWVNRLLNQEKPLGSRIVLEARHSPLSHGENPSRLISRSAIGPERS